MWATISPITEGLPAVTTHIPPEQRAIHSNPQSQRWLRSPQALVLARDEVHVWRAMLDVPASQCHAFARMLTPDEQQRAAQFRFPHLRQRFISGRGILRALLGRYLDVPPQMIRFGYSAYGKPFLEPAGNQAQLHFNVTHAAGMALYAVALGRAVGIDIEEQRQLVDAAMIAERFFSPLENRTLDDLSGAERPLAFLRCWTRKEAYIKARGMGLSLPLDQFSVTVAPGERACLLRAEHDQAALDRWALCELEPHPNYIAALAVEGHDWQLACWQWPE
jgi:4'-phosphopantetheinyl transferase